MLNRSARLAFSVCMKPIAHPIGISSSPQLTIDETSEGMVHCRFTLPKAITKDHISAQLHGRNLWLQIQASSHSRESLPRFLPYAHTLTVPKGTTAAQIRTVFEPQGCFTVIIEKSPKEFH